MTIGPALVCSGVLLGLFGSVSAVRADKLTQARHDLEKIYAVETDAFKSKDVDALMKNVTLDVEITLENGSTMFRKHMERSLRIEMANTKSVNEASFKITNLQFVDKDKTREVVADVTSTTTMVTKMSDKKYHTIRSIVTGKDNWIKTSLGWRLRREHQIRTTNTLDGKPLIVDWGRERL